MRTLLALLLLIAFPAAAGAALPSEFSTDPADRAAWRGLSGTYRLDATFTVRALSTIDGDIPLSGRSVTVAGTAFGAAPGGFVATADHLVGGESTTLAVAALRGDQATLSRLGIDDVETWVTANAARPIGVERISIVLRQVGAPGDAGGERAALVERDKLSDLALLRLAGIPEAPALPLKDDRSVGTPVVAIGFGEARDEAEPTVPGVQRGEIATSGTLEGKGDRVFTQSSIPVSRGDSGGPVLDHDGQVRGMLISGAEVGSNMVPALAIEKLVGRARVTQSSPVQENYLAGLRRFWQLDFLAAEQSFATALGIYPGHALSGRFAERSRELQRAPVSLQGSDALSGFLRMLGLISAIVSLALAAALVRHDMSRRAFTHPLGS